ncbi:MAG: mechanosensitive ion channel family protein [Phycicoccus sp.]|nr:mechanosensitive ion channel family protein [Phycicoccus sp.]
MSFVALGSFPNPTLSIAVLAPVPPRNSLTTLGSKAVGDWWWLIGPSLIIIGTLVGAMLLRWLLHRAIDRVVGSALTRAARRLSQAPGRASRVLANAMGLDQTRSAQRAGTMGAVLKSTSTFVIFTLALLTVMSTFGLPLGPLLASAGVVGVALGFGAQSLVKDFLSGIFMILEDQYGVGDVIDTGEAIGTVEDVTLRVTRLRDASGIVWYIRNGEIVRIGNRSQGWSTAVVDIPVSYSENLDVVLPLIREVLRQIVVGVEWKSRLLEEPTVAGVESIAGSVVTVRIFAKCAPNENFSVQREIRERVKVAFDSAGIRAPQIMPPYGGVPGAPHA